VVSQKSSSLVAFSCCHLSSFQVLCFHINPSFFIFSRVGIGVKIQWVSFRIGNCGGEFFRLKISVKVLFVVNMGDIDWRDVKNILCMHEFIQANIQSLHRINVKLTKLE
jgi:hypothetical protein